MTRYVDVSILLLLLVITGIASGSDIPVSAEEKAVMAVEDEWIQAEVNGDEATLRRVLDERFTANSSDGQTSGKEEVIKGVLDWNMTAQTLSERSVLVEGDTAVIFGTTDIRIASEDGTESTLVLRYTATYIKRDGQWRALALHMSRRAAE